VKLETKLEAVFSDGSYIPVVCWLSSPIAMREVSPEASFISMVSFAGMPPPSTCQRPPSSGFTVSATAPSPTFTAPSNQLPPTGTSSR